MNPPSKARLVGAIAFPLLLLHGAPSLAARVAAKALAPASPTEIRLDHISVVKRGAGSPVVFIPGLASPRASWDSVIAEAARHHTIYLVQVNGFGGDAPGANLQPAILDGIVADLSAFLAAHKVGPVALVGHSMGGLAGLKFAHKHPGQVTRLMIVDALPYFPVLLARGGDMPTPAQIDPIARMMRDKVAARYGKRLTPEMVKGDVDALAVKPASRVRMAEWAAKADPRVTAQLLYEDMSTDLRPALAALKLPITVVAPWSDSGFSKERTLAFYQRQYAGATDVRFVDIADSGHFVMLDQPGAFAAALDAFVK